MNSMIAEALRSRFDPPGLALHEDPSESTRRGLESMTSSVVLTFLISDICCVRWLKCIQPWPTQLRRLRDPGVRRQPLRWVWYHLWGPILLSLHLDRHLLTMYGRPGFLFRNPSWSVREYKALKVNFAVPSGSLSLEMVQIVVFSIISMCSAWVLFSQGQARNSE